MYSWDTDGAPGGQPDAPSGATQKGYPGHAHMDHNDQPSREDAPATREGPAPQLPTVTTPGMDRAPRTNGILPVARQVARARGLVILRSDLYPLDGITATIRCPDCGAAGEVADAWEVAQWVNTHVYECPA